MKDCKSRENRFAISIVFFFKLRIYYIASVLLAVETNIIVLVLPDVEIVMLIHIHAGRK